MNIKKRWYYVFLLAAAIATFGSYTMESPNGTSYATEKRDELKLVTAAHYKTFSLSPSIYVPLDIFCLGMFLFFASSKRENLKR